MSNIVLVCSFGGMWIATIPCDALNTVTELKALRLALIEAGLVVSMHTKSEVRKAA